MKKTFLPTVLLTLSLTSLAQAEESQLNLLRFGLTQRFTFQDKHSGSNLSTLPSWNPSYRSSDSLELRGFLGATVTNSTQGDLLIGVAKIGFAYHHPFIRQIYPEVLLGVETWAKDEGGTYFAGAFNLHYPVSLGKLGTFLSYLDTFTMGYGTMFIPSHQVHHIHLGVRFFFGKRGREREGKKAIAPVASPNASSPPNEFLLGFHSESTELNEGSQESLTQLLERIRQVMKENPKGKIMIFGHADSSGNSQKNMTLSEQRALAIKEYLRQHGVDEARIEIQSFGDQKPLVSNDTPEGRAINRRVEIRLLEE